VVDGEKPEIDSRAKGMNRHQYTGSARDYIQLAVGDELSRLVDVAPLYTGVVDSSYQTQHRQTHSYCPSVTHMVKAGPWSISITGADLRIYSTSDASHIHKYTPASTLHQACGYRPSNRVSLLFDQY